MKRALVALLLSALLPWPAGAQGREVGDTRVFARVGPPGMPEGIAVRDGIVYVGTHASVRGNAGEGPSKIFKYDLDTGTLLGEITIQGQATEATHGVLAMAFDAAGRLYVIDRNPPRVLRITGPATAAPTQETYATVPDLPACSPLVTAPPQPPCSPTTLNEPAFPDYLAFDAAGNLYVTDLQAATIFRVPPGGGEATIWFQDPRLDSIFGPNGIALDPTGTKLYFAMTGHVLPGGPALPTQGLIYTLPLVERPTAGDLQVFFTYEPVAGPDGIAFGASGKLYVVLAGANQLSILSPEGEELLRTPDPVANLMQEVPYDLPASIAFDGKGSALVTNQSFFTANPDHWAVFDVFVDDTALPLVEPSLP